MNGRQQNGFGDALARALRLPSESVYSKALTLFVAICLLLGGAVVFAVSQIILREYTDTERREMHVTLRRFMSVLAREARPMGLTLGDWAAGQTRGRGPLPKPSELAAADIDFFSVADPSHAVQTTIVREPSVAEFLDHSPIWTEWLPSAQPSLNAQPECGFVVLRDKLVLIAIKPLFGGGVAAVGRVFGEEPRAFLEEMFGARVEIGPISGLTLSAASTPSEMSEWNAETRVTVAGPNEITGSTILRAINGTPIREVTLTQSRPLYQGGVRAVQVFLTIITIAGGALFAAMWFLLDRTILNRIRDLTAKVEAEKEHGRLPVRLEFDGVDELAHLARRIEDLAGELERAHLRYRSVVEDQTEIICRFSPSLAVTFSNKVFQKLFGGESSQEMALRFLVPVATLELVTAKFDALRPDHPVDTFLHQVALPHAPAIWLRSTLRATFNSAGDVVSGQWVAADITPQVQAQQRLQDSERQLRSLSNRLLRLQDDERRRIARELHDSTAQSLSALEMNMSLLEPSMADERMQRIIAETRQIARDCCLELRTISYLLHPPLLDEVGLGFAIDWFADGFRQRTKIEVTVDIMPEFPRLDSELETTLFRVLQEAMTNIYRHSGADRAWIALKIEDGRIFLEVRDNGHGLPEMAQGQTGVGFAGMRERLAQFGGKLEVRSSPYGVGISVHLDHHPLHAKG